MGRITHLSISIARGGSTSRCIHIDDTCLITLGWKPTSTVRLSVSFSCRRQIIRHESNWPSGADLPFRQTWQTFRGHALRLLNRTKYSVLHFRPFSLSLEKLASWGQSFHSSTLRITISTDYFNRGKLDEEVSSKVIQRKATSKIVGGKNEILPIVRASFSISLDAAALLSRR